MVTLEKRIAIISKERHDSYAMRSKYCSRVLHAHLIITTQGWHQTTTPAVSKMYVDHYDLPVRSHQPPSAFSSETTSTSNSTPNQIDFQIISLVSTASLSLLCPSQSSPQPSKHNHAQPQASITHRFGRACLTCAGYKKHARTCSALFSNNDRSETIQ